MKLGWVVSCTTHCPDQFSILLSKFLVWPFSQFGPCYMLMPYRSMRRLQPHLHKAGLNWSKPCTESNLVHLESTRLLIWHTLYPSYTCKSFSLLLYSHLRSPSFFLCLFFSNIYIYIYMFLALSLKLVQECPYSIIYQISLILFFFQA